MALTIEDGTVVAGADSYVTTAELDTFVTGRGVTLAATLDADKEVLLRKAAEHLDSYREKYSGVKYDSTQPLQYPRAGATLDGYELADNVIPDTLKKAQMQFAVEVDAGNDLSLTHDGKEVIKKKVGPLETEYAENGKTGAQKVFPKAMAFLSPLLLNYGFATFKRV